MLNKKVGVKMGAKAILLTLGSTISGAVAMTIMTKDYLMSLGLGCLALGIFIVREFCKNGKE